jgi:uncharacterized protein YkwD
MIKPAAFKLAVLFCLFGAALLAAPPSALPVRAAMSDVAAASEKAALSDALSPKEQEFDAEQEFIEKINAERTERGLNALAVDSLLRHTARAHSREMAALGYFSHRSPVPGLGTPLDRYLAGLHPAGLHLAGLHGLRGRTPGALLLGENIYFCSVFSDVYGVDYAHRALMSSPGHRANILEPRFTRIGLGVTRSAAGEFWVTEMFSRDGG